MTVLENFVFFKEASKTGESPALKNIHGSGLALCVSGTFVGKLAVNGTQAGVDSQIAVIDLSDFTFKSNITAAGMYSVPCAYGYEKISVTISEYTSGAITVTGRLCEE